MAYGEKTGGKNFKKGNKFAVGYGRPALTTQQKEFKRLTTGQFIDLLQKYLGMSLTELEELKKKENELTILESYVLCCMLIGRKKGDYRTLETMLNRVIGKPTEKIEIKGDMKIKDELPDEQLRAIGEALVRAKIENRK